VHVLIDQQCHAFACGKRLQHASHRALPVDHVIAGRSTDAFEQVIQARIVERPRQDADRPQGHTMGNRLALPETEVAGEEQDTLALCIRQPDALVTLILGARDHLFRRQRAERQQLQQHLAEVRERRAGDRPSLMRWTIRKTLFEVGQGDTPMRAIDRVERKTQHCAPRPDQRIRQPRRDASYDDDRPVLDRLPHLSAAFSVPNSEAAGSNVTTSGTR
jgi:hypothetical protein